MIYQPQKNRQVSKWRQTNWKLGNDWHVQWLSGERIEYHVLEWPKNIITDKFADLSIEERVTNLEQAVFVPSGILSVDNNLSEKDIERIQNEWRNSYGKYKSHSG